MANVIRADHIERPMEELARRLRMLEEERGCCVDLDSLAARLPLLDDALAAHQALADRSRLTIVALLARQPGLCGCEFQSVLGVSHATVSHHMRVLQDAGIVDAERQGRWMHYELTEAGRRWAP